MVLFFIYQIRNITNEVQSYIIQYKTDLTLQVTLEDLILSVMVKNVYVSSMFLFKKYLRNTT